MITMRLVLAAVLLSGLGLAPRGDPESLVRAGNAAFDRGDPKEALALYDRAVARSTDPGLVALNRAAVLFHSGNYAEAEAGFRCCLDPGDSRRPRALLGVGACLLQVAVARPDAPDRDRLKQALRFFDRCLAARGTPPELAASARSLRAQTRLLLAQLGEATRSSDDPPMGDDPSPDPPNPEPMGPEKNGKTGNGMKDKGEPVPVPGMPGGEGPMGPDGKAGPAGSAPLPPVPKDDEGALPPEKAAEAVKQAVEKVLDARTRARRERIKPPPAGVKDW